MTGGAERRDESAVLVIDHLGDLSERTYFLCGPQAFMEHVKGILLALGVPTGTIIEEKFDGPKTSLAPGLTTEACGVVEFVRSGKTATVFPGHCLLETAEAN